MGKAAVMVVHKTETMSGKMHEVIWAGDGDLNAAVKRGNIRRFRLWVSAKKFAVAKAQKLGARLTIS